MNEKDLVISIIKSIPVMEIIDIEKLYREKLIEISRQSFDETLSEMIDSCELAKLSNGVYCIPKIGKFGIFESTEDDILKYALGREGSDGIVVGYKMYNKYKLTTQISKKIEVYSNVINLNDTQIKNVSIHKVDMVFTNNAIRLIVLLEVLQNYMNIEDMNEKFFLKLIKESVQYYNKDTLSNIIRAIEYKNSTIASLKNVLEYFEIENDLYKYLNETYESNPINIHKLRHMFTHM